MEVDQAVAVEVGLLDHGPDLHVGQRLPEIVHGQTQLFFRYEAVPVAVKDSESVRYILVDDQLLVSPEHHLNKLVEIDGAIAVLVDVPEDWATRLSGTSVISVIMTLSRVPDHVLELLVSGIESVVAHHPAQLVDGDFAVVVGVEQGERLLQAVELRLGQLGRVGGVEALRMGHAAGAAAHVGCR